MLKKLSFAAIALGVALSASGTARAQETNPKFHLELWTLQDPNPTRPAPNYYQGPNVAEWRTGIGLADNKGGKKDPFYGLYFAKMTGTFTDSGAGAYVKGIKNEVLSELGYDFKIGSHCGAGAPRFNVYIKGMGEYYFSLGCYYGNRTAVPVPGQPDWRRIRFTNADVYPSRAGQAPWPGFGNAILNDLWIVFDEGLDQGTGYFIMDNITLNGFVVEKPRKKDLE